jgi:hypothetical protein
MIDEGRLQDLIELGRTKGRLSTEDLQQAMPVGTMSVGDLAEVILRLERDGIDVDIDPALLQPDPGGAPRRPILVEALPDSALGTEDRPKAAGTASPAAVRSAGPPDADAVQPSRRSLNVSAAVLMALGVLMLLVLLAVFLL